jgi:hypothetical protein
MDLIAESQGNNETNGRSEKMGHIGVLCSVIPVRRGPFYYQPFDPTFVIFGTLEMPRLRSR